MQSRARDKLVEFGYPGFLAGLLTRGVPKLRSASPTDGTT